MKRTKYFLNGDSEICYNIDHFKNFMKENDLTELDVFKAIPTIIGGGVFWCQKHSFCGDGTSDYCGNNNCKDYQPRNKISGVCKHHRHWLYDAGDKITLRL